MKTPADYQRALREKRLANSVCVQCGKHVPHASNITCDFCLEKHYQTRTDRPRRIVSRPVLRHALPPTPIEAKVYYAPKGSLALAILGCDRTWNTR